jgi:uncharacterized phage-associated protein
MTDTAVDAKGLANLFLDWSAAGDRPLSPMKIQKLLFFAHADFLIRVGRPLVKQEFEAWDYGPVIPSVYREFKRFKDQPITDKALSFNPISAAPEVSSCKLSLVDLEVVRRIFDFYSRLDAIHLSQLSHEFEGVWRQARSLFASGLNMDRRISNDLIVRHHRPIHS